MQMNAIEKVEEALKAVDGWWRLPNSARTITAIEPAMIKVLEAIAALEAENHIPDSGKMVEVEKESDHECIAIIIEEFNDQPLVDLTLTNISRFFNKACNVYHAKKCAECNLVAHNCYTCAEWDSTLKTCARSNVMATTYPTAEKSCGSEYGYPNWQPLPEAPKE